MSPNDHDVEIWLAAIPDAVLLVSPEGDIRYANPAAVELFAPEGGALVGTSIEALVPTHHRARHQELRRDFHAEAALRMRRRHVQGCTLDGQTIEVEVHVGPGPDGMAIAIVRDVADRLRQITKSRVQLAALSATSDAVLICDATGRIEYINDAFTDLTGYTAEQAVGDTPRLFKSDWHGPAFYRSMWSTITNGEVWRGEVVNRRIDGTLYTEEQSITPVTNERGVITHYIAIKHDISARAAAQTALKTDLKSVKLLQDLSSTGLKDNPTPRSITDRAAGLIHSQLNLSELFLAIAEEEGTMVTCVITAAGQRTEVTTSDSTQMLASLRHRYPLAVGIRARKQLLGSLGVRWLKEDESDKPILIAVAAHLGTMVRQAKMQGEIRRLAETDSLTGLANRRQLFVRGEAEVGRALRYSRSLSVLLCDLDHFKEVNDTRGHAAGDALLQEISAALTASARDSDIVARYGGEEFVMLLVETGQAGAVTVAERVRDGISNRAIMADGVAVGITTSIGIACFRGDGDSLTEMLNRADKALYRAKEGGRNRAEVAM